MTTQTTSAPTTGRPLEGIRVLDLSSVWAMPCLCASMADLGAEVIKIEALQRLDPNRSTAGIFPERNGGREPWNVNGPFSLVNRGKRSITLDLSRDEGRDAFRDLTRISDVVVENYTPRVMRGWELSYPHLRALNPEIIMISNTGYGHDSPWENYPVQGTALEPMTGITHFSGYRGDRPSTIGQSYPDFVAMWHGLFCIMTALRHRATTGEGQWIDLGMYQANVSFIGEAMLDYVANGRIGERIGNRDHSGGVQGCYQTMGDDRWMVVSARNDAEWQSLTIVLGPDGWSETDTPANLAAAYSRHDEVDDVLTAWAAGRTREEAVEAMRGAGVPAGPVNDARDLLLDPHLRERAFYELVDHAEGTGVGRRPLIGRGYRLSRTPPQIDRPAPPLGEANEYVFKELLGMSDERFEQLSADAIIGRLEPLDEPDSGMPVEDLLKSGSVRIHDPEYRRRLGLEDE